MDRRAAHTVPMTAAYRVVVTVGGWIMRWARLRVTGLDALPLLGPTLVIANHDSYWDPIAIAVAARPRRQIRALAKSTLWKVGLIGRLMDSMGHIPIARGATNEAAVSTAIDALAAGACIGVFPEGTRSLGTVLRAHSGAGRLALAVPEATLVCARVTGTTDVVRLPKRPHVTVEFYRPADGARAGEGASALMQRLLDDIRRAAPPAIPGRNRTSAKYAQRAAAAPDSKAGSR